jgi:hypothetical protein
MTEDYEHQPITSGIKHWGLSGYSSVLPRIKFGVTGQESSPQSPTISYRQTVTGKTKFCLDGFPEVYIMTGFYKKLHCCDILKFVLSLI